MKVLVTGATGCLGRNLCQRLAAEGCQVTGLGRNRRAGEALEQMGARFLPIDLEQAKQMTGAMLGHETVFHCAALSSQWAAAQLFERANVLGTANVLAAAKKAQVRRVVFVSSTSVYFDFTSKRNIQESDPLPSSPVNAYAASKRKGEELVLKAANEGLDAVILRPRGIFGPWDSALAPRLARVARRGIVPMPDGGKAMVDVTCVANVVEALLCAASAAGVSGRIYNISNGVPISVEKLLRSALDSMGMQASLRPVPLKAALFVAGLVEGASHLMGGWEPPVTTYSLGLLGYDQTLDITAAKRDLGWAPRQSLEDGLATFGQWWKEHHGQS
ncbi:Nucleoside-diphosphate-sugar epimerase [Rhodospirillaceae bacterium LM-1]|nr:Nucleoside-diphosphate-sugar epimerase [Rhodospirillaceae bacterium LM-1]